MAALAGEEDLARRVADLEASLATALARLEVAQVRERRLRRENNELSAVLRGSGLDAVEGQLDESGQPLGALSPKTVDASMHSEEALEAEGILVEEHPVNILTPEGKVPAVLLSSGECFEFVELRARITPAEFVGIKQVKRKKSGRNKASRPKLERSSSGRSDDGKGGWLWRIVAPIGRPASPPATEGEGDDGGGSMRAGKPPRPPKASGSAQGSPAGAQKTGKGFSLARLSWGGMAAVAEWQHPAGRASDDGDLGRSSSGGYRRPASSELPDIPSQEEPSGGGSTGSLADSEAGQWDILWKAGGGSGPLRRLTFSATAETRAYIQQQVESWASKHAGSDVHHKRAVLEEDEEETTPRIDARPTLIFGRRGSPLAPEGSGKAAAEEEPPAEAAPASGESGEVVAPLHLSEGKWCPKVLGRSDLLGTRDINCLTNMLPRRYQQARWELAYSTEQHGISLQTMYRRAIGYTHTMLVVQDGAGFVFGSFNTEAWKMGARYFGTGESFVFQIQPHMVAYPWKRKSKERNDFFQFAATDSVAVGGGGHFAIWMDQDLAFGNSGVSDTFGNPCLSGSPEFRIKAVELWGVCV